MLVTPINSNISMKSNLPTVQTAENIKLQKEANEATISSPDMYDGISISPYPYLVGDNQQIDKCLGPVYGNALWSRSIAKDIGAAFKSIKGGKINAYTELAKMTQRDALADMIKNAKEMGANGVIGYTNTERGWASDSFMRAQGIAVKIKDGNCQKDIDEMKKNGVNIASEQKTTTEPSIIFIR